MNPKNKSIVGVGLLTAITASLCCITPVLAFIAGVSGVAATFSWLEPFRPYLIGLTVLILGFAWYQKLKPRSAEEIACACEPARPAGGEDELSRTEGRGKPSFWQSKKFLGIVTVFAVILLFFPAYSSIFFPNSEKQVLVVQESNIQEVQMAIKGMTCTGCEEHVKHTALQLDGVLEATASYEEGKANIKFDQSAIGIDEIAKAIEKETGYKVMNTQRY